MLSRFGQIFCWLLIVAAVGISVAKKFPTADVRAETPTPIAPQLTTDSTANRSTLAAKPISEITVGTWVKATHPTGENDFTFGATVDPTTWRLLKLHAPKNNGTTSKITLLRPLKWIENNRVERGGTTHITVPECGIDSNATVLAIEPCPEITPCPGDGYRIVTGTFQHFSSDIIDLYIDGLPHPIGTTANHPFWSETRQQFVRADTLIPGEHLRAFNGTPMVTAAFPRPGPTTVYNLEVQVTHTYHITKNGLLVHNGTPSCPPKLYQPELPNRPIHYQKQSGHIPGKPQYKNRIKQGTTTSAFFGEKSGNAWTQKAWREGIATRDPKIKIFNAKVSVGTGPNGGMQRQIRVVMDARGRIHGSPWGPEF